jgi:hypothetical protein
VQQLRDSRTWKKHGAKGYKRARHGAKQDVESEDKDENENKDEGKGEGEDKNKDKNEQEQHNSNQSDNCDEVQSDAASRHSQPLRGQALQSHL